MAGVVDSADLAGTGSPPIVSIVVTCTGMCTPEEGEGTTVVTFGDGAKRDSGWSYNGEVAPSSP